MARGRDNNGSLEADIPRNGPQTAREDTGRPAARVFPAGTGIKYGPIVDCECGVRSPLPHCGLCGKHHPLPWRHPGYCEVTGCDQLARVHRGKPTKFCPEHSVVAREERLEAAREASRPLAVALDQTIVFDGDVAYVPSRTDSGVRYRVDLALDGEPVCSCTGYEHHGHCWHSEAVRKELMTTTLAREPVALVPVQVNPPKTILPTMSELSAIKMVAQMAIEGAVSLPAGVNAPEKAASIMLYGWELGIPPMTSLQELYIVNGKVQPSAKIMAGLVAKNEPDSRFWIVELTEQKCTIRFQRPQRRLDVEYTVTWADIEKAKLNTGNNLAYPKDRLTYHCMKRAFRIFAPDLITNLGPMVGAALTSPEEDDGDIIEVEGMRVDRETGEITVEAPVEAELPISHEDAKPPKGWTPSPAPAAECEHQAKMGDDGRLFCSKCKVILP